MKTYTVIYRTGGTVNFAWHKVNDTYTDKIAANDKAWELNRMGYLALVHDTELLKSIGMPETY